MTTATMASNVVKDETSTHQEHVPGNGPQSLDTVSHNIHHPKGWMTWRFIMYSE